MCARGNVSLSWTVDNSQYAAWGHEQDRGGIVRAEWAFGHSIALGCTLSMAVPLAWIAPTTTRVKTFQIVALALGTVASFSRAGLITLAVATALTALLYPRGTKGSRLLLLGIAGLGAVYVVPKVQEVFAREGQLADISANYRLDLNSLLPFMNPFGLADGYFEPTRGTFYFHGFKSIDSTFILLGVSFGYIVLATVAVAAVSLVFKVLRRRGSPADVALVSVLPALFTVALITQFGSIVWFMVGMAGAFAAPVLRRREDAVAQQLPEVAR